MMAHFNRLPGGELWLERAGFACRVTGRLWQAGRADGDVLEVAAAGVSKDEAAACEVGRAALVALSGEAKVGQGEVRRRIRAALGLGV